MKGFATIDESMGLLPFMRGGQGFYIKEHHRASALSYDWTGSLYDQTSISGTTSVWNTPDVWSGSGFFDRGPNTQNYKNTVIVYVDTAPSPPELKMAHIGHAGDGADDFQEVETGIKAKAGNNELVILTSNGVPFDGVNLVDGTHFNRWKHKHDAKSDTHFTTTAVLLCADNVLTAYTHWQSHGTLQSGNYVSAATAISSGTLYWQITWDPDNGTWTVNTSEDFWQAATGGNVSLTTSGGTVGKGTTDYNITGSSPADGRMWEITVGTP